MVHSMGNLSSIFNHIKDSDVRYFINIDSTTENYFLN